MFSIVIYENGQLIYKQKNVSPEKAFRRIAVFMWEKYFGKPTEEN